MHIFATVIIRFYDRRSTLKKDNEKLIRYLIIVVKFVKLIIINLSALFIKDECSYLENNTQLIIININMSL